jgi:hypothetical protein
MSLAGSRRSVAIRCLRAGTALISIPLHRLNRPRWESTPNMAGFPSCRKGRKCHALANRAQSQGRDPVRARLTSRRRRRRRRLGGAGELPAVHLRLLEGQRRNEGHSLKKAKRAFCITPSTMAYLTIVRLVASIAMEESVEGKTANVASFQMGPALWLFEPGGTDVPRTLFRESKGADLL